jgi:hypothetical protein
MTRKAKHGIKECEDCRRIMLLLVSPREKSNRFNSLLRKCQANIDKKYSAPRLQRHLKGLEGIGMLKREKKSNYHTEFSTNIPKDLIQNEKLLFLEEVEKLNSLPLNYLIKLRLNFFRRLCIAQTIIDLEELLDRTTPQESNFKRTWLSYAIQARMSAFDNAMHNRSEVEHIEALKTLKELRGSE